VSGEPGALAKAQNGLIDNLLRFGVDGFGPFKSAEESAEDALGKHDGDRETAVKHLIRTHVALAGAQGFVTNLGGLITLPITLPTNITAAYMIQTHLIASIAAVHGRDLESEEVQTAILLCLVGNAGTEMLKKVGLKQFNKKVAAMLIAKYGGKRAGATLAKGVPLVGGVIGGGFDAASTRAVGAFARRFFTVNAESTPMILDGEVIAIEEVD
jgi:hypothetical protein